jgi:formylglycine-generating enzyme required for sulfatase activity
VESVSWFDAVDFCNLLSEKSGLQKVYTGKGEKITYNWQANGFRLPTEVEWEYACRAGMEGDRYGDIDEIAWYNKNSGSSTQAVGRKRPNAWGLYDMLGNVWEWCWDWYGKYPVESQSDWYGPGSGTHRVLRGGCCARDESFCRAYYRANREPSSRWKHSGFRVARSL